MGGMAKAKLKTHRGAAKRFRRTPRGKFLHKQTARNHNLGKKSSRRLRRLSRDGQASPGDAARLEKILPYA